MKPTTTQKKTRIRAFTLRKEAPLTHFIQTSETDISQSTRDFYTEYRVSNTATTSVEKATQLNAEDPKKG